MISKFWLRFFPKPIPGSKETLDWGIWYFFNKHICEKDCGEVGARLAEVQRGVIRHYHNYDKH